MVSRTGSVQLSVVIPAHNSAAVIEHTVQRLGARLAGRSAEILIVENGSTDDTFEVCSRLAGEYSSPGCEVTVMRSAKGLGNALRAGAMASRGEEVLFTADDLPFGFDDLDGAEELAAAHGGEFPTMVIGSKAHPDSEVQRGTLRDMLTWGFATLRRVVLGMRTGDPQGTFLVHGDLIRGMCADLVEPGFLFTTELVYIVEQQGVRPVEVPVRLSAEHASHGTRVSRRDVVSMGAGVFRIRRRRGERAGARLPGRVSDARR